MCLCVGCWLEGGPLMGKDPVETIEYFGSRKKLFKVHLRNVTAPLPHSTETLLDDGYYDMYKVMKALKRSNSTGLSSPTRFRSRELSARQPGAPGGEIGRVSPKRRIGVSHRLHARPLESGDLGTERRVVTVGIEVA